MKTPKFLPALVVFFLAACGGGGGSGGGPIINPPPSNGIVRTGMSVGPISSFGSIVVNGIHYDTAGAVITVDGVTATQADLRVGQVVSVTGELEDGKTSGTATTVVFDDNVEGPITSIDDGTGVLVVLGQTIRVDGNTSFDDSIQPRSIEGLAVGDFVEVSGLVAADGSINATRIEQRAPGGTLEVKGIVSGLDTGGGSFELNGLVVDYSAAQLDDFPAGGIADGQAVEAKGDSTGAGGELVATRVEYKGAAIAGDEDDFAEIEGFITRFASEADFDVSGVPVTTGSGTAFSGGTAADLGLNVKVEVEGLIDADGAIAARKVDIRLGTAVRLTALVDSVDAAGDSLVVLGIPVNVDALTRFEDQSDAKVEPLTLADLSAGDYVEIRGGERPAGSGEVLASILERDDIDTRTELQGFVTAVAAPTITVLGVTIETDGATEFRDVDGSALSQAEFFSRVAAGELVKARGAETSGTTILAEEVQLEN